MKANFNLRILGGVSVAVALYFQLVLLGIQMPFLDNKPFLGAVFGVGLGFFYFFFGRSIVIRSLIITVSVGGLGMLIGMNIDSRLSGVHHVSIHHEVGYIAYLSLLPTYMTAFMILFCLPACLLFCRFPGFSNSSTNKLHCISIIPMVLGMLAGVGTLSHLASSWFESEALGHYLSMMVGMAFGLTIGLVALKSRLLKPMPTNLHTKNIAYVMQTDKGEAK